MLRITVIIYILALSTAVSQKVQWAKQVVDYSSQSGTKAYSATEILGKPSVMPNFGKSAAAWSPVFPSSNFEWIRLGFEEPVYIRQILINENLNPGAIVKIYIYDSIGRGHQIYGNNSPKPMPVSLDPTRLFFNPTNFRSKEVKIELNLSNYLEEYQIDAVGISDTDIPIPLSINLPEKMSSDYIQKVNLGPNINSKFRELAPIISSDGKKLFFTREGHPDNYGPLRRQDVWYSEADEAGNFGLAKNIGPPINNDNTNFAFSLSPDGNVLYLGHIYLPDGRNISGFSKSTFDGQNWSFPESLNIANYYNRSVSGSFSISSDGKTMLLAIERDDTFGNMDIYVSFQLIDGTWSEPLNLGNKINTAAEEVSPFLAADGKTLYFSTSGFPGYGDNDMFFSKRLDDTWTRWSEPVNLGPAINTRGWDAYYTITADGQFAYFVSSENSIGTEDIFKIKLPEEVSPEAVYLISGKVINAKTKQPIAAKIKYETLPDGKDVGSAVSNATTGEYKIVLPGGQHYGYYAVADGFVAINENLDLRQTTEFAELNIDLFLVPIEKGQTIRINNIFFEFGKFDLLEESYSELNRLTEILKNNKNIKILLKGHTDNVGSDQSNIILSENRARAVRDYLVNNGIEQSRITLRGYGRSQPIADNSNEEGRSKNRRVEFEILND